MLDGVKNFAESHSQLICFNIILCFSDNEEFGNIT